MSKETLSTLFERASAAHSRAVPAPKALPLPQLPLPRKRPPPQDPVDPGPRKKPANCDPMQLIRRDLNILKQCREPLPSAAAESEEARLDPESTVEQGQRSHAEKEIVVISDSDDCVSLSSEAEKPQCDSSSESSEVWDEYQRLNRASFEHSSASPRQSVPRSRSNPKCSAKMRKLRKTHEIESSQRPVFQRKK